MSTSGRSTPSLKRSTENTTLTAGGEVAQGGAALTPRGVGPDGPTRDAVASLKTRAMKRAWSTLTQKPSARMVDRWSARSATSFTTWRAQASLAV